MVSVAQLAQLLPQHGRSRYALQVFRHGTGIGEPYMVLLFGHAVMEPPMVTVPAAVFPLGNRRQGDYLLFAAKKCHAASLPFDNILQTAALQQVNKPNSQQAGRELSQGDLPGKCPKCHIDRPGGSIAPFRADGDSIEQNGRQHRKPWYPAEADLPQQAAGNSGPQRGSRPHKEVDQPQKIGAGGSAYTIGDGAAQGNAPNSGMGCEALEIPAGKRDPGETPEQCGRRELEEECGFIAGRLEPLAALYPTPAYCDEKIWIFTAKDLTPGHTHPDEDEFITAEWVPLAEAERMVLAGEIEDAKTQIAILKYTALRRKGELHE